jgi:hypothetical protein
MVFLSLGISGVFVALWGIRKQVDELYKWHDQRDTDGVPVWYMRKSLETAILQLSENLAKQTEVLQHQTEVLRDMKREIEFSMARCRDERVPRDDNS